jgi:hypothetical protein
MFPRSLPAAGRHQFRGIALKTGPGKIVTHIQQGLNIVFKRARERIEIFRAACEQVLLRHDAVIKLVDRESLKNRCLRFCAAVHMP